MRKLLNNSFFGGAKSSMCGFSIKAGNLREKPVAGGTPGVANDRLWIVKIPLPQILTPRSRRLFRPTGFSPSA